MSRIYVDPENIRYVKAGNRYKKGGTKQMYTYDLQELKWFFKILVCCFDFYNVSPCLIDKIFWWCLYIKTYFYLVLPFNTYFLEFKIILNGFLFCNFMEQM